jgi:peptidoglycan hydrolase-like protein with peptidoglycan-binding domain
MSSIKSISAPHLGPGRSVRFGRRRPVALGPRLKLANYLRAPLPAAPPTADYSPKGQPALGNVYLNDRLGDCVIAGAYHVVATETGNAGALFTATTDQLVKDYSAIGGYNPADPNTDQGCDEPTALNYWVKNGFANGTRPLGWVTVDATNADELRSALYLFENLYFGAELPDAWVNPMPSGSGFSWDAAGAPVPDNGHCVIGVGYTTAGVTIDTWGLLGTVTWDALAKYFTPDANGATYVLLTPDQLAKGQTRAPNGLDWSALISDFDAIGGHVPPPGGGGPTPAPTFDLQTNAGIQQALNYLHVVDPPLVVDGRMGPKTKAAVKAFQETHDCTVDGIVGPQTRAALRTALAAT